MSEPLISVQVSEAETLTNPVNREGQAQEHVSSQTSIDDSGAGSVNKEDRVIEVVNREGGDAETKMGRVGRGDDEKVGSFSSGLDNCDVVDVREGSPVVVSKNGDIRGLLIESKEGLQDVVEVSGNQSVGDRQHQGAADSCKGLNLNREKGSPKENSEYGTIVQVYSRAFPKDQGHRGQSMHPDLEQGHVGISDSADLLHDSIDHMDKKNVLGVGNHAPEYLDSFEGVAMEAEVTDDRITGGSIEDSGDDSNTTTEGDYSERKPSPSKLEFNVSDLVWGKVRSHPWWPGQICDPSTASMKAKKYFKKDSYLIAYFGDQSFAWNNASRIKNFQTHFSQMERQSNSEDFHHAVDNAVDEVSGRVEYSLACSCIPKEVYTKLKTQIITNAGIADESKIRDRGDKILPATSFDPNQLIGHVKSLAYSPLSGFDKLDLAIAKAQLMAFYRAKGYPWLTEYKLHGVCEDGPQVEEELQEGEFEGEPVAAINNEEEAPSGKGHSNQDNPSRKRKNPACAGLRVSKKEKTLSDLMIHQSAKLAADEKQMSSSSGRKRKVVGFSDDSSGKHGNSSVSLNTSKSQLIKKNFGVGDSIRRAANQLLSSSSILKSSNGISQLAPLKNTCKRRTFHKSLHDMLIQSEVSSPDEMLSYLYVTAMSPMGETNLPDFSLCFFSEYHCSMSHDDSHSEDHELFSEQPCGAESGGRSSKVVSMADEVDLLGDCYWTDRLIESIPDEQLQLDQNGTGEFLSEPFSESGFPEFEPQYMTDFSAYMISDQGNADRGYGQETCKPMGNLEDGYKEDVFPTELILEFTSLDSLPSEAKLNKIFSRFGSLIESETEVVKESGRAKVVFKRHADAETACNSAAKYNIFGQSDVVYRLKYIPPSSVKPSPRATKRGRKAVAYVGGDKP